MPIGVIPRTVMFIPSGYSREGRLMIEIDSGEIIGSPDALRAMPGISRISRAASADTDEFSSAVAPFRITSSWSGWPDAANTRRSPAVNASDVTSTATVRPIPTAVISAVPLRCRRLRRLYEMSFMEAG